MGIEWFGRAVTDISSAIRNWLIGGGMRNVMLGHSGDGKTTFVASAYAHLQNPVAGFTLRTVTDADHNELLSLADEISRGHYPPGTTARSEYRFTLRHEGNSVLDFTWADYRGGALMDSASAAETRAVLADLRRADAIQVFVDAAAIAAGKRVASRLGRITSLIAEAIGGSDRPVAIAFILTKYDLVPAYRTPAELLAPIRGLMGAVKAGNHVTAAFRVAAGPSARGLNGRIDRPILFALRHGLTAERDRRANAVSERQSEWYRCKVEADEWKAVQQRHAREVRDRPVRTWLKWFFDDVDHYAGEESAGRKADEKVAEADRALAAARSHQSELDRLMPSVRALDAHLDDLETF